MDLYCMRLGDSTPWAGAGQSLWAAAQTRGCPLPSCHSCLQKHSHLSALPNLYFNSSPSSSFIYIGTSGIFRLLFHLCHPYSLQYVVLWIINAILKIALIIHSYWYNRFTLVFSLCKEIPNFPPAVTVSSTLQCAEVTWAVPSCSCVS